MFREIVGRLLAYPQRGQIKIDFDLKRQVFSLSLPIFSSRLTLPQSIKKYVEARKNSIFKPHKTSFQMEDNRVLLSQEVPFALDPQASLRNQVDHFWQMSKRCHQMLSELAIEEQYKNALHLDSHFEE